MASIRFLHTSDWQLGMTRHFFSDGVQERYNQARFDSIRKLGETARKHDCRFVIVCGDAFDSNQVDRRTIARACEALKEIPVPVYILPGNHDPLNAASVYGSSTFSDQCPSHVHIVDDAEPREVVDGVEIIGQPWKSKRPVVNPLEEILSRLDVRCDKTRIVMGHGILDTFTPDKDAPAIILAENLERAVADGKADFIALGDRHSITRLSSSNRVWYSGTPEATDFPEEKSGYALVVELEEDQVNTQEIPLGEWVFIERQRVDMNYAGDIDSLVQWLKELENKEKTVLRLRLFGGLTVSQHAELETRLDVARDLFAGFDVRMKELAMVPDDADFSDLGFSGFAQKTVAALRDQIEAGGSDAEVARDAFMLLFRLAKGKA